MSCEVEWDMWEQTKQSEWLTLFVACPAYLYHILVSNGCEWSSESSWNNHSFSPLFRSFPPCSSTGARLSKGESVTPFQIGSLRLLPPLESEDCISCKNQTFSHVSSHEHKFQVVFAMSIIKICYLWPPFSGNFSNWPVNLPIFGMCNCPCPTVVHPYLIMEGLKSPVIPSIPACSSKSYIVELL